MRDRIIPYNRNEILLGVFVEESVSTINKIQEYSIVSYDKHTISDLINIKTYLVDKDVLEHIESQTGLKKAEILKRVNKTINNWFKTEINEILEKNDFWVEDSLWREVNTHGKYLEEIDGKSFLDSLHLKNTRLSICTKYKNVVERFDDEITEYLLQNTEECIDILLKKYEEQIDNLRNNDIYVPKCIKPTSEEGQNNISSIVLQFIDNTKIDDYSRMEKMRLLSISMNLKLSKKVKFSAMKKYTELNKNYFGY